MLLPQDCPRHGQPPHEAATRWSHAFGGAPAAPPIFMTEQKYYAGVGSRDTPNDVLKRMRYYATVLAERGYWLRSGRALGADTAFEDGATIVRPKQCAIYLPWAGYNDREGGIVVGEDERLGHIAARYHPAWHNCRPSDRKLHTRNVPIILGHTQTVILSDFVLCWTDGALGGGGTGQAIRIAKAYGVPVYDLADAQNNFEKDWLY